MNKGLSQTTLAERLSITKSMISAYETGTRMPSYDVLCKISSCFHVSIDYLLGFDKRKMLDISNLSNSQTEIISRIIDEFNEKQ